MNNRNDFACIWLTWILLVRWRVYSLKLLCCSCVSGSESSETQEDVYVASVETDRGVKEQLRLYDTKGLHDGQDLPKHYYSVADGFVLVYSVDSLESFKKVDILKKEIDKSRDKKEVWCSKYALTHDMSHSADKVLIDSAQNRLPCFHIWYIHTTLKSITGIWPWSRLADKS